MKELIHIVASRAKDYDDLVKSGQYWLNYFTKHGLIEMGDRILDFGAGLGRISIQFSKVADVYAIDGNEKMVEFLLEKGIKAEVGSDCKKLVDNKEWFDFVISPFVLQHIHFPEAQKLVGQISKITDRFFFTYPIMEDGIENNYVHYTKSKKVLLLKSHDVSRTMKLEELPELFKLSDFDTKTIKRHFVNLFEITK